MEHASTSPVTCSATSATLSVSTLTPVTTSNSATMPFSSSTSTAYHTPFATSPSLAHQPHPQPSAFSTLSPTLPFPNSTGRLRRVAGEPRLSPNLAPMGTVSCPQPAPLPTFEGSLMNATSKSPATPSRRSRGTSPSSSHASSALSAIHAPITTTTAVGNRSGDPTSSSSGGPGTRGESGRPASETLLPPMQNPPSPAAPKHYTSFSPPKGPGPRVELADTAHGEDAPVQPVAKEGKRRPSDLVIHTASPSSCTTASPSTATTSTKTNTTVACGRTFIVVPGSGEGDVPGPERGPTSVSSFSTSATFSMAPRDSSIFSFSSFDGSSDAKASLTATRATEDDTRGNNSSEHAQHTTRHFSQSLSAPAECSTTLPLPLPVPSPPPAPLTSSLSSPSSASACTSAPGSETRMSRCKRKMMQSISAPAFDIKLVEEVNQQVMSAHGMKRTGSVPDALSVSVRQQKLGGDGAMRIHLPGAEDVCFTEDICNAAECHAITKVNDFIYLGTWRDAKSVETLKKHNITYVLNCAKEVDHSEENGGNPALKCNFDLDNYDESLLHAPDDDASSLGGKDSPQAPGEEGTRYVSASIPMSDSHKERLEQKIDAAFFFILLARRHHANVLVHCRRGISRSAAVVIAFLMATTRTSFHDTYAAVLAKRSCVSLNLGFQEYLDETFSPDPKWTRLSEQLERRNAQRVASAGAAPPSEKPRGRPALSFCCPPQQQQQTHTDEPEEAEAPEPHSPFHKPNTHRFDDDFADKRQHTGGAQTSRQPQTYTAAATTVTTAQPERTSLATSNDTSLSSRQMGGFESPSDLDEEDDGDVHDGKHAGGRRPDIPRCPGKKTSSPPSDSCGGEDEEEGTVTPTSGQWRSAQGKFLRPCITSSAASSVTGGCTTVNTSTSHGSSRGLDISAALPTSRNTCHAPSHAQPQRQKEESMFCVVDSDPTMNRDGGEAP